MISRDLSRRLKRLEESMIPVLSGGVYDKPKVLTGSIRLLSLSDVHLVASLLTASKLLFQNGS
jgi:hypothetical protein